MPSKSNKKSQTSKRSNKNTEINGKRARKPSEEETYVVEKILEKKKIDGVWKYKVKWEGYSEKECTWEPAKHLEAVKEMLAEFNKRLSKKEKEQEEDEEEDSEEENQEEQPDESEEEEDQKEEEEKPTRGRRKGKANANKGKSSQSKASQDKDHMTKSGRKSTTKKSMGSPYKKVKADEPSEEPEPIKKTIYGHFKLGDQPKMIESARKERDEIIFTIQWKARTGGKVPLDTEMTGLELRKYDKDLLLDFYEERLKFVKPAMKESMRKSVIKAKPEEERIIEEELNKQNEQRMKEEETNETTYRDQEIVKSEVGMNDLVENIPENKKEEVHDIIDLENSPQEIEEEKSIDEVQEIDKSEMPSQTITKTEKTNEPANKIVFDVDNTIDNKGQTIFADLGSNVADDLKDLALDEHLRVVSQSHQDLSKPTPVENGVMHQENGLAVQQGNGATVQDKPEPSDLLLDSPKEISDIGSDESSGLDNI